MPVRSGTLPDSEIKRLVDAGQLITSNFDERFLKQACYEVRASDVFYETSSKDEDKKRVVDAKGYILRPHCYVTVIVQESIDLPDNVLGRIIVKGQLFSIGVVPVSTYADPGFSGRLGITLCNFSHRHLIIRPGQAIAKIEFSKLTQGVAKPYTGQHGYDTSIWPVPTNLFAKKSDLLSHGITETSIQEISLSYGPVVAALENRMRAYEKKVWIQLGLMLATFLTLIALSDKENWVASVLIGIVTNLLTTYGLNFLERWQIKGE